MNDKPNALQATLNAAARQAPAEAPAKPARLTRMIGGHFSPAVAMQLRMIAAERDTTIQNLLAEALDLLFAECGKDRIARL